MSEQQKVLYDSGNELAAYAAKQINYHVMGYYPITPSTQIAENLDLMKSEGLHDLSLIHILERDFGFRPCTSLRDGLRKFAQWYKEFYM